jgi:hypothetical protein
MKSGGDKDSAPYGVASSLRLERIGAQRRRYNQTGRGGGMRFQALFKIAICDIKRPFALRSRSQVVTLKRLPINLKCQFGTSSFQILCAKACRW